MSDEIYFDGIRFVSAKEAAVFANVTRDYIARLARSGKIKAKRIGKNWYVEDKSLHSFLADQERVLEKRRTELMHDRKREYQKSVREQSASSDVVAPIAVAPQNLHVKHIPPVHSMRTAVEQMLAKKNVVSPHMRVSPLYVAHPIFDFAHKVTALVTGFVLIFGTYGYLHPESIRHAYGVAHEGVMSMIGSEISNIDVIEMSGADTHVAAAASNGTFAKVSDFFRTLFGIKRGEVLVKVQPYTPTAIAQPETRPIAVSPAVISSPIVERIIETTRTEVVSGVTEALLNARLATLFLRIEDIARLLDIRTDGFVRSFEDSDSGNFIGGSLEDLTITNSSWTGGTITNATITGGSIDATALSGIVAIANGGTGTSSAPSYGRLLVGNSFGGYDLLATSSLGIIGAASSPGGPSGAVQYNNGGVFGAEAAFSYNATTNVLSFDYASSSVLSATSLCLSADCRSAWPTGSGGSEPFPGNATSSTLTFSNGLLALASTTIFNLTALNATTTNATTTNLAFTNLPNALLATNAQGRVIATTTIGANLLDTTGNWSGTFDGFEGSYYLANSFSTTSASNFTALGLAFSTTSSDAWKDQRNFFSTTSADYYTALGLSFSTTSAINFIHSSTTIPKTYTANTFTNTNTFTGQTNLANASSTQLSVFSRLFVGDTATTTIFGSATSTFGAGIRTSALDVTGSATSTFANGINLASGCFSVNNVCVTGSGSASAFGQTFELVAGATALAPTSTVGIIISASSTIGSGAQAGGLTIIGGATTTGFLSVLSAATSTFVGGVSALRLDTTATSTLAGVRLTNILGCTEALETDAFGNVICGTDATAAATANDFTFATNYGVLTAATTSPIWAQNGIFASSTSHFVNADFTNSTTTNATTSNLAITNAANALLSTNASGAVVATSSLASSYLTGIDKGFFFSTTSADAWKDQRNFFSTTSASYFSSLGLAFSTTSNDAWKDQRNFFSTTSADYYSSLGLAFSTTSAINFVHSSTTIPKSYTTNTFTGLNTFTNGLLSQASSTIFSLTALNATSTNATTTNFAITSLPSSLLATDSTGRVIATTTIGANLLDTTGNWSGTFDGQEGSFYLANSFSTSSASNFSALGLAFSTTSSDAWKNARNFFSTTSADHYSALGLAFSTTSAINFVHSSTTIPKTYTSNVFTGDNTFSNGLLAQASSTIFSLTALNATTTNATTTNLAITSLPNSLLATDGSGRVVATTTIGANLLDTTGNWSGTFDGFEGSYYLANSFSTTSAANFSALGLAFSTTSNNYWKSQFGDWSVQGDGYLAPTTTRGILVNASSTIGNGTLTGGLTVSGGATTTGNALFSSNLLVLGSTTLQNFTFLNATGTAATTTRLAITGITSSLLVTNSNGSVIATTTLQSAFGGTGFSSFTQGDLLYANANGTLSRLPVGAPGEVLKVAGSAPAWGTDLSSGGGAGGTWSTTTSQVVGTLINYPNNTSDVVAIGSTATTTAEYWFDPNTTTAFFSGRVGLGTTSPWRALSVAGESDLGNNALAGSFTATSTSIASIFPYASTTALSATTLCLSADCRSAWPTGGGASFGQAWEIFGTGADAYLAPTSTVRSIIAAASSTIGSGAQAGGLTISGGATTTGNAYFASSILIGTTTPWNNSKLTIENLTATSSLAISGGSVFHTASGTPTRLSVAALNAARDVFVSGRYAYVSVNSSDLFVYDVSNPKFLTQLGSYTSSAFVTHGIHVSGQYAYMASVGALGAGGLQIFDVSNPTAPMLIGSTTVSALSTSGDIYVSGSYAYLTLAGGGGSNPGLYVIDVSNPTSPVSVARLALTGPAEVVASGKYLYIADNTSGLRIVNIESPTNPILVGTFDTTLATGVAVSGRYAYVADSLAANDLIIVNIANPASPSQAGAIALPDTTDATKVAIAGKYAYVVAGTEGVYVVDVASSTLPAFVGNVDSTGTAQAESIFVSGKYLYLAEGTGGVAVLDINGIETPALAAGTIETGTLNVTDTILAGGDIFAQGGLHVGLSGIFSRGAGVFTRFATTSLASSPALLASVTDSNASSLVDVAQLTHMASSSAANGIGSGLLFAAEDASTLATSTARIGGLLTNVATATPTSALTFSTKNTAGSLTEWMRLNENGNLGIGTTSPFARLTTWGSGTLFEAVNNASTSIFRVGQDGATTTNLAITNIPNAVLATDSSGNVYATTSISGGFLDTSGNWSGTFDGQEGSYYLANSFSTTSASNFSALGLAFSTTSSDAWKDQRNFFSTTSATYFSGAGLAFSTTSSDYWKTQFGDWSVQGNGYLAPTTTRGILVSASSTIGSGTQTGGLTISGGATTTGNALFSNNLLVLGSTTLQNFTFLNATGTAATTSALAVSGIASGSLVKTTIGGALIAAVAGTDYTTFGYLFPSNATSTMLTFTNGLIAQASSTIFNLTALNATTTNATTTNLALTGVTNALLSTNGNGSVIATTSLASSYLTGIDKGFFFSTTSADEWKNNRNFFSTTSADHYTALGLSFSTTSANHWSSLGLGFSTTSAFNFSNAIRDWSVQGNGYLAPTTTRGVIVNASSTIGSGTQAGGLTISGGATTTGNAVISGTLSTGGAVTVGGGTGTVNAGSVLSTGDLTLQGGTLADSILFGLGGVNAGAIDAVGLGVGTTSPGATLAIHMTSNAIAPLPFLIASSTANSTTTLFSISNTGLVSALNLLLTGSTTLQNFTFLNATGTAATTTNLAVSSIPAGSLVKTTTGGALIAAVAGTDYTTFGYLFPSNATSTMLTFTNGLIAQASSTIFNLTAINSTTTAATTTNLAVTGTSNALLSTNASGAVVATSSLASSYLTGIDKGFFFSTTSADAWKDQRNFFSTTSAAYFSGAGLAFSTTSADAWKDTRNFFSTTSVTYWESQFGDWNVVGGALTPTTTIGAILNASSSIFALSSTISTSTNATSTNLFATNANFTNATSSNFFSTRADFTNLALTGSTTLQNLTFLNATGTAATTTNLAVSSIPSGSLIKTTTGGALIAAVAGTDYANFGYLFPSNATTTMLTFSGGLLAQASSTIFNFTALNATTTNATTTNLVATAATTSNLAITNTTNALLSTNANGSVIATTSLASSYLTGIDKGFFFSTTSADAWKDLRNFFSTTSASHFSSLGLAFSTTSSDYWKSQFGDWSVQGNGYLAPTTTRGILVNASSTIGSGAQTGGLTISGGATTTGNAYFGSRLGIGTTTPWAQLSLQTSNSNALTSALRIASSSPLGPNISLFDINNKGQVTVGGSASSTIAQFSVMAGTTTLKLIGNVDIGDADDVYVQGRYAYTIDNLGNGFDISDVSDPSAPVVVGSTGDHLVNPTALDVQGDYAYIANQNDPSVVILDVSDPARPTYVSSMTQGIAAVSDVKVQGRYAYVLDSGSERIIVFDVSNPAVPKHVGSSAAFLGSTFQRAFDVVGKYAYVADQLANSLFVVDLSNPSRPIVVGSVGASAAKDISVQGRYAYILGASGEFSLIDVKDPYNPVSVTTFSTGNNGSLAVQGRYLYIYGSGLIAYDISNPAAPLRVAETPLVDSTRAVFIQGRYAYAAAGTGGAQQGLSIFDLGGAYVQQLEAGGIEAGSLALRNDLSAVGGDFRGGVSVGNGLAVSGSGSFQLIATTSLLSQFALSAFVRDNNVSSVGDVFSISKTATGTIAAGIGSGLAFQDEYSNAASNVALRQASTSARITSVVTSISTSSPAADLAFYTRSGNADSGLAERMRLTSTGRLGVGTTSPYAKLSVQAAGVQTNPLLEVASTSSATKFLSVAADGFGTTTLSGLVLNNSATTTANFGFRISSGCYQMPDGSCVASGNFVTNSGTNASGRVAYWNGTGSITSASSFTFDGTTLAAAEIQASAANPFLYVNDSDTATADFRIAAPDGTAQIDVDINNSSANSYLSFRVDNRERARFDTNQAFLIGTTTGYATTTVWGNTTSGRIFEVVNNASTSALWVAGGGFSTTTVSGLNISGSATTTSNVGINLSGGCFSVNNTCLQSAAFSFPWTPTSNFGANTNATSTTLSLFSGLNASSTVRFGNSGVASQFLWDSSTGRLGIGTSTPQWQFQVASSTGPQFALSDGSSTSNHWAFRSINSSFFLSTSSPSTFATSSVAALTITPNAFFGIATSSPYARLSVAGSIAGTFLNADATSSTSTLAGGLNVNNGAILHDFSSGLTSIENLALGALTFAADSGIVTWIDMPVTSSAVDNTVESYTAKIDGSDLLTLYSQSNGSGGIKNLGVGIGTTSPWGLLSIEQQATNTPTFVVADTGTSTPHLIVSGRGYVGLGTTTPSARLSVNPSAADTLALIIGTTTNSFLSVSATGFGTTTLSGLTINGSATSTSNVGIRITSTSQGISLAGLTSCTEALETDASGNVICGTDATGAGGSFPFTPTTFGGITANATSTLIGFTNGLYSTASSTIFALTSVTSTSTNATSTNLFATNANFTNATSSNFFSTRADFTNLALTGSTTLQNFTFLNATGTAATTTNLAVSSIPSGSLIKTTTGGALIAAVAGTDYANFAYLFPSNATTTMLTFSGGLLAQASSTIFNFTALNATTTNATTTNLVATAATTSNLAITNTANALLSTNANGSVIATTSLASSYLTGIDKGFFFSTTSADAWKDLRNFFSTTSASYFSSLGLAFSTTSSDYWKSQFGDWSVQGNGYLAPTTTRGILVNASSTIGSGAQTGGLTISGGATTTGNALFSNELLVLGSTTLQNFSFLSATGTKATTTDFFSTGATITNATTTRFATQNIAATGSTTLQNFTFLNATGTAATTSALTVTGTASTTNLIVSSAGGAAGCATFSSTGVISNTGSACGGSGSFAWTPTNNFGANTNATSTTLSLFSGLNASTTVRFGNAGVAGQFLWDGTNGRLGIGTSSPYARLSVVGPVVAEYFHATSTAATSTFAGGLNVGNGALTYDYSAGLTSIENLAIGSMEFDADSGIISWADMPVTASAATGTIESYTAQIDGNPVITAFSKSNGMGGVWEIGAGIGSSTPWGTLSVEQQGTSTNSIPVFVVADQGTSTPHMLIHPLRGFTGFGTTTPLARLSVNPISGDAMGFVVGSSTSGTLLGVEASGSTTMKAFNVTATGANATSTIQGNLKVAGTLQVGNSSLYLTDTGIVNTAGGVTVPYASSTAISVSGTASTTNLIVSSAGGAAGCATFSAIGQISNTGTACGSGGGSAFGQGWEIFGTGAAAYLAPTSTIAVFMPATTSIATTSPWGIFSVGTHNLMTGIPSFVIASSSTGVATSTQFIIKNGFVGVGPTTTPWAMLSINPNGGLAAGVPAFAVGSTTRNLFSITSQNHSGALFDYGSNSTTTIKNNSLFAWTVATSTTAFPMLRFDTVSGSTTVGVPGGDVTIGAIGTASNLVFEESSVIHAQGNGTMTFGAGGDKINFNVNTGFGSTTPGFALSVQGSVGLGALSAAASGNIVVCINDTSKLVYQGSSATTCTPSSIRFKENVETSSGMLDEIRQLRPVTFYFKDKGDPMQQLGLIAEEVMDVDPRLVQLDSAGQPGSLKLDNIMGLTLGAIKELDLNLLTIAAMTASSTPQSNAFADGFFNNLFSRVSQWLASATNGITEIFAKTIRAENVYADTVTANKLCLEDVCVTKAELQAILNGEAITPTPPAEEPPTEEPPAEEPPAEEPPAEEPPAEEPPAEEPPAEEPLTEEPAPEPPPQP